MTTDPTTTSATTTSATTTSATTTSPSTPDESSRAGRRKAILGLAGLAAGGATAVIVGSQPAGAAGHGQALILGDPANTANDTTGVSLNAPAKPAFRAHNTSLGSGVVGIRDQPSGISIPAAAVVGDSRSGTAIAGASETQTAIVGRSSQHNGIAGYSSNGSGVIGESNQYGVFGKAGSVGTGVAGYAEHDYDQSAGVIGFNRLGIGVMGWGKVQARLMPADVPGPPTRITVSPGSFHVDSLGVLRYAATSGAWRTVASPTSAGAFHVLPAPVRVYDSRPGTHPAVGTKTKLAAGAARTVDLKANASGVPAGATAALVTVLLVNAPKANGNLTVWAAGVARPQANTLVWGGDAGRFTTQATTALDAQAQIQVLASHATDIVIDVVGYYG